MLLPVVLFALLTVGFWVPCVLVVASKPRHQFLGLSKWAWLILIAVFWVFGAAAWLLADRPAARRAPFQRGHAWHAGLRQQEALRRQREALRRHPSWRATQGDYDADDEGIGDRTPACPGPAGPDDDPGFLLELERQIREAREGW
jgi:general stress protein CsbA